jgi:transcriptional regulator
MSRKLFLKPKLTREDIIKEVYVPHNKFAQLFTRYAGMSFTKFINDLRLEYAAQLLRDSPDYTIEAIGEECGMPIAQTFYRNFSDKFGVTPSDFRTLSQKKDRENQEK